MRKLILAGVALIAFNTCGHATDIGNTATHGFELRSLCVGDFWKDAPALCYMSLDRVINSTFSKLGFHTKQYDVPADTQMEAIEQGIIRFLQINDRGLDKQDATAIVQLTLACTFPGEFTKAAIAKFPDTDGKLCAMIAPKSNT